MTLHNELTRDGLAATWARGAFRDAADLLDTTIDGTTMLADAIGRFEAGMRQRGGESSPRP
ncbi:hypothetical protein [Amycolatopsis cihanbeyliensis]|uniref:Uncharacterized protein n=1 Tax=Amycolatopsis cihanbeyliensis TaxID=1128664 RepID=A0A542DDQ8_AMYCI|nr:hypothetical protein [Amycolatopsis cihanbeyliensis]TQJ01209.1 hypothetical protein FB471_0874 [Amycolatopsis cihanbeyliensis]